MENGKWRIIVNLLRKFSIDFMKNEVFLPQFSILNSQFSILIPLLFERRKQMKHLKQFLIILTVSFIGEILNRFVPLPVPASIYGIVIMFLCLLLKIIKLEQVKDAADFLIAIMPVMFIPAAVGLIDSYATIKHNILAYVVVIFVSTVVVMAVSGLVTQLVIRFGKRGNKK